MKTPVFYLATPPSMFREVAEELAPAVGLAVGMLEHPPAVLLAPVRGERDAVPERQLGAVGLLPVRRRVFGQRPLDVARGRQLVAHVHAPVGTA